jgi:hypothetical protein
VACSRTRTRARRPHIPEGQGPSHDRAARCYLEAGDTSAVQHDKTVTMSGTKGAGVLGKRGDGVLGNGVWVDGAGFFVGDINVVATNQSDAQHNLGHG